MSVASMDNYIAQFEQYLKVDKKISENTRMAYIRDIREYGRYITDKDVEKVESITDSDIKEWLRSLKKGGKTMSTVNRKLASVRAFFRFLIKEGRMSLNPASTIKAPKVSRKEVEYLSVDEMESILAKPDKSVRGVRDKAILELLYATGLRVSELAETNVSDLNMHMGFIKCGGGRGKARIIPLGRPSRSAIEQYLYEERDKLLRDGNGDSEALFLNYSGQRLTRQALWKIIRSYAEAAGITTKITPQIFRNSFAVHMIKNGADIKTIQELLGHEDISATQIYLSVAKNRIKEVYDNTHPRAR